MSLGLHRGRDAVNPGDWLFGSTLAIDSTEFRGAVTQALQSPRIFTDLR
jgi:hypothetical protein